MDHFDSFEATIRGCGAPVSRTALLSALEEPDHGAAFADWARLHLGPETVLTKDELVLSVSPLSCAAGLACQT